MASNTLISDMIRNELSERQKIASEQLDQIRVHPEWYAHVSRHAGRYPEVRWSENREMYEIAETTKWGAVEVEECIKDDLLNLFAENPVEIRPLGEAMYSPKTGGKANLWHHVATGHENVTYVDGRP